MLNLRQHFDEILHSEFYRNIAGLFSGIAAARAIPGLFALLIARLYTPSDFGWFVLVLSLASTLSIPATGGFEKALLLTGDQGEKQHLMRFSLRINRRLNAAVLGIITIYMLIDQSLSLQNQLMLILIPVYAYFLAAVQLMRNLMISNKAFKRLSMLEVFRAIAIGGLQSIFFIFPNIGLFLGIVLAQIATYIFFNSGGQKEVPVSLQRERVLARRYVNFPKFSVASELINFVSGQLPVFLIKPFFGAANLGLYGFSHRYLSLPVQLTTISIGSVYVQKAQTLATQNEALGRLTFALYKKQFWLAILPFTLLGLWGESIFGIIFGSEWAYSGKLGALMAPWLFMVFIGAPLATILVVREKQKVSLLFNLAMLFFRAAAILTGGWILRDLTTTIALYSMVGFLFFMLLTGYALHLSGVSVIRAGWFSAKVALFVTVPMAALKLWL